MKLVVVIACLFLGGCGTARDLWALGYCAANQNDINRRCD